MHNYTKPESLDSISDGIWSELPPQHAAILRYFGFDHLASPESQRTSSTFATTAVTVALGGGDPVETSVALRKLLEAKDAAVRAGLGL